MIFNFKYLNKQSEHKLNDLKLEELRKKTEDSCDKLHIELEQRKDESKKHLESKVEELQSLSTPLEETAVETETVYESLEFQESLKMKSSQSLWVQICSCVRCSIVIIFSVALIIAILVVLPLKITFSKK